MVSSIYWFLLFFVLKYISSLEFYNYL